MNATAVRVDNSAYKKLPVANLVDAVDTDVVENLRKYNSKIKAIGSTDLNHRWKKFVVHLAKIAEHKITVAITIVLTLYSLFSNDVRVSFTHSEQADMVFEVISSITFFFFMIDITITSLGKFGSYFQWPETFQRGPREDLFSSIQRRLQIGSFYFWFDVAATATLILEMPWLVGEQVPITGPSQQAGSAARVAVVDRRAGHARAALLLQSWRWGVRRGPVHRGSLRRGFGRVRLPAAGRPRAGRALR